MKYKLISVFFNSQVCNPNNPGCTQKWKKKLTGLFFQTFPATLRHYCYSAKIIVSESANIFKNDPVNINTYQSIFLVTFII